jgi:hypothetical protein
MATLLNVFARSFARRKPRTVPGRTRGGIVSRAFGPSNGSDRIGGSWLAHGGLSVRWCRGQVAGTSTPMSHQTGAGVDVEQRCRELVASSIHLPVETKIRAAGGAV